MKALIRSLAAAAVVAGQAAAFSVHAAEMPKFVVVAVNEGGSALNAIGNALAKLISDKTPMASRLRTQSGILDVTVNSGDADFAMSVSVESHMSTQGLEHYKGRRQANIRVVAIGPALVLGVIVKKSSPYKTVADLKGARVTSEYTAVRPLYFDMSAMLTAAGLGWNDLRKVPTESIVTAVQALMDGSADATVGALGAGILRNADASLGGIRFLTLGNAPDLDKKLWKAQPGYYSIRLSKGAAVGVVDDTVVVGKDMYFISHANLNAEAVYAVTKAMWNDMASLHAVHPLFQQWTPQIMVKPNATVPYHPGAVRFYKEVGAWTPEMEQRQAALVKQVGGR